MLAFKKCFPLYFKQYFVVSHSIFQYKHNLHSIFTASDKFNQNLSFELFREFQICRCHPIHVFFPLAIFPEIPASFWGQFKLVVNYLLTVEDICV